MAEFCTIYHEHLFGKMEKNALGNDGVDIVSEGRTLKHNHYIDKFLCEGCGKHIVIYKSQDGKILASKNKEGEEINLEDFKTPFEFYQECKEIIEDKSDSNLFNDFIKENDN